MRKLVVFNFITLKRYFKGPNGDTSWHKHDTEENRFAANMLKFGNTLLFPKLSLNPDPSPAALTRRPRGAD